ncbi:hypothetical protein AAZX31_11G018000 [Glycine max]
MHATIYECSRFVRLRLRVDLNIQQTRTPPQVVVAASYIHLAQAHFNFQGRWPKNYHKSLHQTFLTCPISFDQVLFILVNGINQITNILITSYFILKKNYVGYN